MIIIAWILFRTIDLNQTRIDEFISSTRRPNQNSGLSRREVFFPVNLNLSEVKAVDVISAKSTLHHCLFIVMSLGKHLYCLSVFLWKFTAYFAYFHIFRNFPGTCPDLMMPEHSAFPSAALWC